MNTITKTNNLSLDQSETSNSTFVIKLTNSKFDNLSGVELFNKVESWVAANMMMNNKEVPTLIVDMENVEFIDSQGLQKLLASLRLMQSKKSNLMLCSLQASVRIVLEITRADQLLAVLQCFDNADQMNINQFASDLLVAV